MGSGKMRALFLLLAAAALAGCAHPIAIAPYGSELTWAHNARARIPSNVGYFIPAESRAVEVTTQGGGGDNVRYFPYRDIDEGFGLMLGNVFTGAQKLSSLTDSPSETRIDYVIVPTIVTTSGGSGLFTWPPTNFTVDLTCTVRDPTGVQIAMPRVVGVGTAETGERLRDHAIAGRRAMADALVKMQAAMLELKLPGAPAPSSPPTPTVPSSAAARLSELKDLKDKGLISEAEYEVKRKAVLDSL
jgi:hypothetical protein